MKLRHFSITDDYNLMTQFNKKIDCNIDRLTEQVESALGMWPDSLIMKLVLLPNKKAVSKIYRDRYEQKVSYVAFISLSEKKIWVSVKDISKKVLAHEIAHGVVNEFFTQRPPYHIHELLAQYAEKHAL